VLHDASRPAQRVWNRVLSGIPDCLGA